MIDVVVLPVFNVSSRSELVNFLEDFGDVVTVKNLDTLRLTPKSITVGKIVKELKTVESPDGSKRKVYYMESAVPGDVDNFRLVITNRHLIKKLEDVFRTSVGDYLGLYEVRKMDSAADVPSMYFPTSKATTWVCTHFKPKPNVMGTKLKKTKKRKIDKENVNDQQVGVHAEEHESTTYCRKVETVASDQRTVTIEEKTESRLGEVIAESIHEKLPADEQT